MKHIAFIGDSFCAYYSRTEWLARGQPTWQVGVDKPAWPSIVTQRLGLVPHYHGYGGKSWWYSRHHFLKNCQHLLDNNQLEAVIICHTEPNRSNTTSQPVINYLPNPETEEEKMIKKAQDMWRVYLLDPEYARWSQNNWLLEIRRIFAHVPRIIQFTNFDPNLFNNDNFLGMCFTSPLNRINLGVYLGTNEEIIAQSPKDTIDNTPNHFTPANNIAMAEFVVDAINNYQPGLHEIDLEKFDIANPNIKNLPGNNWSTK